MGSASGGPMHRRLRAKFIATFAMGLLKAHVCPVRDLLVHGSHAKAKQAGAENLVGKTYVVQTGDCIEFSHRAGSKKYLFFFFIIIIFFFFFFFFFSVGKYFHSKVNLASIQSQIQNKNKLH